jgi:hypothetical protein
MRRRTKGLVYLAVIVCVLILGTLIVFRTQGERIAIKLGDFLTSRVGRDRNISIEMGSIGGSLIRDIELKDILVTYTGGEAPKILFSASSVYARFNLAALLLGKMTIDSVAVVSPKMIVPTRPDGSRIYVSGDSRPGPPGKRQEIEIKRLLVSEASVDWTGEKPRIVTHLSLLGSLAAQDGGYSIEVWRAWFRYGAAATVEHFDGMVRLLEDRVEIDTVSVRTPRSGISLSGYLARKGSDSLGVRVKIDSLALGEVPAFMGGSESQEMGSVAGSVSVGGTYSDMEFEVGLDGSLYGWPLEDLSGDLSYGARSLDVERLSLVFNEVPVNISCKYDFSDAPAYRGVVAFSHLDLARFIDADGGDFSSDLTGNVRFRGSGVTAESFEVRTWPDLGPGRYEDWKYDSVGGRVTVTAREVVLDSVKAGIDGTEVDAGGRIGFDGETGLDFAFDIGRLEGIRSYHGVDGLEGSVKGTARLEVSQGVLGLETDWQAGGVK